METTPICRNRQLQWAGQRASLTARSGRSQALVMSRKLAYSGVTGARLLYGVRMGFNNIWIGDVCALPLVSNATSDRISVRVACPPISYSTRQVRAAAHVNGSVSGEWNGQLVALALPSGSSIQGVHSTCRWLVCEGAMVQATMQARFGVQRTVLSAMLHGSDST